MRWIVFLLPLLITGCSIFSTPGRVTSPEGTSDAGGVYMHVVQPSSGKGCPSAIAFGAQTMGSIDAGCWNNGATQSIHATAPDPNPALTTAYSGINQQMSTIADVLKTLIGLAQKASPMPMGAAGPTGAPGFPVGSAPMLVCPVGTIITMQGDRPVCL